MSESRMRENLTYGLMRRGRLILCPLLYLITEVWPIFADLANMVIHLYYAVWSFVMFLGGWGQALAAMVILFLLLVLIDARRHKKRMEQRRKRGLELSAGQTAAALPAPSAVKRQQPTAAGSSMPAGQNSVPQATTQELPKLELLKQQLVERFISGFLTVAPSIEDLVRDRVEYITDLALRRLTDAGFTTAGFLYRPDVQERIRVMQDGFAGTGEKETAHMMADVLADYVSQPDKSIVKSIAADVLAVLPKLTEQQLDILSLLLLVKYTRRSDNGHPGCFYRYVSRYLVPLSANIPLKPALYQYLEYLGCCQLGSAAISLEQILFDSYPAVFRYQGFTSDELKRVTGERELPPQLLVPSIYRPDCWRLNAADDALAVQLLRSEGMDEPLVEKLMALQRARMVECGEARLRELLQHLHPDLAYLSERWNQSPLLITRLSLKGIYLAHINIRRQFGENLDLSMWFS